MGLLLPSLQPEENESNPHLLSVKWSRVLLLINVTCDITTTLSLIVIKPHLKLHLVAYELQNYTVKWLNVLLKATSYCLYNGNYFPTSVCSFNKAIKLHVYLVDKSVIKNRLIFFNDIHWHFWRSLVQLLYLAVFFWNWDTTEVSVRWVNFSKWWFTPPGSLGILNLWRGDQYSTT